MLQKKLLFYLLFILPLSLNAQVFEGFIEYQTVIDIDTIKNDPLTVSILRNRLIAQEEIYSKKDSVYTKEYLTNGSLKFSRLTTGNSYFFIDHFKQNIKVKTSNPKLDTFHTYNTTNETKNILGYECKKVIYTVTNRKTLNDLDFIVYYTEKLPPLKRLGFGELDGLVLSYETEHSGQKKVCTATRMEVKSIPNLGFVMPKDYSVEQVKD